MSCTFRMSAVMIALVASAMIGSVQANTITSSEFSLGYGFTSTGWNTSETSSVNTATTLGDFSFVPTVSGSEDTSYGPVFTNRVLSNGGLDRVSSDADFSASVVGSWSGATPSDAAANPNYRTTLEITSMKIWTHSWNDPAVTVVNFHESTAGHTGDYGSVVPGTGYVAAADTFTQLVGNPTSFEVAGTSSTRTFGVVHVGGTSEVPLDGFEVFGRVVLTYDATAAPEPAAIVMLLSAMIGFVAYAWRKRR